MATQGTAQVDFGNGARFASVPVTGQAGFVAGTNLAEAWIAPVQITGSGKITTEDEHWAEMFKEPKIILPITATGFSIMLECFFGIAFGKYQLGWVYN